jgi:hypothetical protein
MLFQSQETLEESIVRCLAGRGTYTAKELHQYINKKIRVVSLKAIYKALHELLEQTVIIKIGKSYFLHLQWVQNMGALAVAMEKNSVRQLESILATLEIKKVVKWEFKNFINANRFWTHFLLLSVQKSRKKLVYEWCPHPWYYFIDSSTERHFQRTMSHNNVHMIRIVGGDSDLDKSPLNLWTQVQGSTYFVPTQSSFQMTEYFNVIDDYYVSLKISRSVADRFDRIFNGSFSVESFKALQYILQTESISISIIRDQTTAKNKMNAMHRIIKDLKPV